MNISRRTSLTVLLFVFVLAGCVSSPIGPTHDEVLVYDKPFDYTYLKVLEAINSTPGWSLYDTDKEAGVISAWNETYDTLLDDDMRRATFQIRRLGRRETSVQLTPDC